MRITASPFPYQPARCTQSKCIRLQRGLSLVELMISLAIALGLLSAAATMALASLGSSKDNVQNTAGQQEVQAILTTITRDIRRAAYSTPLNADNENIKTSTVFRKLWGFGGSSCVVYRYDRNAKADALLPPGNGAVETNEIRGIRLNTDSKQIEILVTGGTGTPANCAGAGTWEPLASGKSIVLAEDDALKLEYITSWIRQSDNATITQAQATTLNTATAGSAVEAVDAIKITLTGEVPGGTAAQPKTIQVSETVQLRNRPYKFN